MSIHSRNPYILNGGDQVMQCMGFFLMFAPAGAVLGVDRWRRIRQGKESADQIPLCAPWAQRMIQIQASVLYFATFYYKSQGPLVDQWHRLSLRKPAFGIPALSNAPDPKSLRTQGADLEHPGDEFSLGVLVWFRDLRYRVLLAGLIPAYGHRICHGHPLV